MIRLLIGGSPCTRWSIAQTKNRETTAEGVGWELFKNYLIALEKYKPDYFLYENNKSMSSAIREQITRELGVEPIMINSALVSAQSRQRLYWTNIPGVDQPEDMGILLRDILESGVHWREKAYTLRASAATKQGISNVCAEPVCVAQQGRYIGEGGKVAQHFEVQESGKTNTLTTVQKDNLVAVPVRIGTVESDAKNADFDSQQYRVYSPDGKAVTLCGQGGGVGAKTGLYATPVRVGDMPNAAGEISGSQSGRIHSIDGKGVPLQARPNGGGADGAATGLYAIPAGIAWRGREDGSNYEVRDDQKANTVTADGHQSRLVIVDAAIFNNPHGFNNGGIKYDKAPILTANGDWQHNNFVIESADGKTYPVYMVKDGQITIKGKQYPIRLADGFYIIRKLTVTECKRLQTVPDSYIFPVSDTQAYKMLGNGWTVDVIVHILGHVPDIRTAPLEVFSMYDGMACGHIALDKLGGHITRYFATEIDKYAIQTTMHNFPDVIQMGDAYQVRADDWSLPAPAEAATGTEEAEEMEPDAPAVITKDTEKIGTAVRSKLAQDVGDIRRDLERIVARLQSMEETEDIQT